MEKIQVRKVKKSAVFFSIIIITFNAVIVRMIIDRFNVNPHLIAIENILQKEIDERFWVDGEINPDELISNISVYGTGDVYAQPDIFSKVEKAQRLVYSYVMEHSEAFRFYLFDARTKFSLCFENEQFEEGREKRLVFLFRVIEGGDYDYMGFNQLFISGIYGLEDIYYNMSNMVCFKDISFLKCEDTVIDNTYFLDEMKKLKRLDLLEDIGGDIEGLRQKAESLGIRVDGYECEEDVDG